jgi:DNA-directed RNA polymerase II subunit RPB2
MMKQALGIPMLSYNLRTDTILHVLHYPQKPLITTDIAKYTGFNEMPSGAEAIVAIMCFANNQEDSVCINQSAIERGFLCLTSYHTLECTEKKRDTYSTEKICLPPKNSEKIDMDKPGYFKRKMANYSLLDENGIIRTRSAKGCIVVKRGDVLVGKVVVSGSKTGEEKLEDASLVVQAGEEGTIDKVFITTTPNGYKLVKIVIRVQRQPTLGDKVASSTAQKGTIGMVYRQEDLPFTASGIVPDIIINALCIPSRMTVNQLIESALGKECCIAGKYMDATPFTESSEDVAEKMVKRISKDITGYGFSPYGWETMYSGITGEQLEARIFIGPTYYQRLKHLVDEKLHARAKGHVTTLTRQPLEGRLSYIRKPALVMYKSIASPYTMGKTIGSGKPLKLLLPSLVRNNWMASGKTRRCGYNIRGNTMGNPE